MLVKKYDHTFQYFRRLLSVLFKILPSLLAVNSNVHQLVNIPLRVLLVKAEKHSDQSKVPCLQSCFNELKTFFPAVSQWVDLSYLRIWFFIHLARIKRLLTVYTVSFRLFGTKGFCTVCCKTIPAFEMVMRARENVYHLECFSCQRCHQRFCVGDKFYLINNRILCVDDYEEMMAYGKQDTKRFIV